MSQSQGFYSEDEAQRILSVAARDLSVSGMSREELVRAAGEMGISSESIARAEAEIQKEILEDRKKQEEKKLQAEFNRYMRSNLLSSLGGFISGAALFIGIWLLSGAGYFWPAWILFFWGLHALSEISDTFLGSSREKRYRKWLAKRSTPSEFESEEANAHDKGTVIGVRIGCRNDHRVRRIEALEQRIERERSRPR